MTKFAKAVGAWVAALALASCGGGGGSGTDGGFTAPGLRVSLTPAQTQTTPFSLVDVPVRVTSANGAAVTDGTQVTLQVSSGSLGLVSSLQRIATSAVIGERVTATTSGGTALFRFHSRAVGTMNLTATAADVAAGSAQVSATTSISIVAGPSNDPRLAFAAQTTTLPINRFSVTPFLGSPFMSEVTVTWRRLNGELVTVTSNGQDRLTIAVAVNPVNSIGGFSMLDDPETEDDPTIPGIDHNEFLTIMGQAPVNVVSGKATIFFHSFDESGTSVMTITAQDPDTNETLQTQVTFNVVSGSPRLPATISLQRDGRAVYASNSGGNSIDQVEASVYDGSGDNVPDPGTSAAPANNLEVEIVGGAQNGERLRSVNAQGAVVSGSPIRVKTAQGLTRFTFEAGTRLGSVQIRATADRADNNVDNGISDPVSSLISVTVGDGRLFDLDITTPTNATITEIMFNNGTTLESTGSYTFNLSALATDRYGNPVIPGTEIRFGLIDSPYVDGTFAINGSDGDPQEAGTGFNAPTGAFKTAGGGAGPNDTVIVFGEESNGNRDLESARRVATVPNNSNLTVTQRFNYNDDTGATVNNGPVLPYVIGRAVDANIAPSGYTDQFGVAFAKVAFPATKAGKLAAVYAQGNGDVVGGAPELVTDAELMRLSAIAPGTIIASPDPIAGNTTVVVQACLVDANSQGIPGAQLTFSFDTLFGMGSVDGIANQGQLANLTGPNGCADATVVTSGLPNDGGATLKFSLGAIEDSIDIRVNNNYYLYAFPSRTYGDGARLFTLRLVNSSGVRVPNVLIVGECEASSPQFLNISTHPGLTNAQGETTTIVDADGFDVVGMPSGSDASCTFRTINDEAEVVIVWGERDICDFFSPSPPVGCPTAMLTVTMTTGGTVMSTNPSAAVQCIGPGTCTKPFQPFENVTLNASANATWGDACSACGTGVQTCTVALGDTGSTTNCDVAIP
ncbi:MAG: hypothetical protein IPF83_02895 [Rhodanobacteraceae bacterium]|nr:hypothetical protein [Rhodanobacteraceae bacterium]